jgi:hypothetical protein
MSKRFLSGTPVIRSDNRGTIYFLDSTALAINEVLKLIALFVE